MVDSYKAHIPSSKMLASHVPNKNNVEEHIRGINSK